LVQDSKAIIERIAAFLDIQVDGELLKLTCEQSSLQHMAAHRCKYDEHPLKNRQNVACGLDQRAGLDGSNQVCFKLGNKQVSCIIFDMHIHPVLQWKLQHWVPTAMQAVGTKAVPWTACTTVAVAQIAIFAGYETDKARRVLTISTICRRCSLT
jgi:hypothetical protein